MLQRFEIFFVGIAAARQEQQAAARGAIGFGPVDAPDGMAVRGKPQAFPRSRGNGATVEWRSASLARLANSSLLPVVTF
jgi:hypothetical protein